MNLSQKVKKDKKGFWSLKQERPGRATQDQPSHVTGQRKWGREGRIEGVCEGIRKEVGHRIVALKAQNKDYDIAFFRTFTAITTWTVLTKAITRYHVTEETRWLKFIAWSEVGIYKRKQENKNSTKKAIKKTRKQELDQEKKKKLSFSLYHLIWFDLIGLFYLILHITF